MCTHTHVHNISISQNVCVSVCVCAGAFLICADMFCDAVVHVHGDVLCLYSCPWMFEYWWQVKYLMHMQVFSQMNVYCMYILPFKLVFLPSKRQSRFGLVVSVSGRIVLPRFFSRRGTTLLIAASCNCVGNLMTGLAHAKLASQQVIFPLGIRIPLFYIMSTA